MASIPMHSPRNIRRTPRTWCKPISVTQRKFNEASDPLYRSAELGKANQVQGMITFMPLNKKDEGESA